MCTSSGEIAAGPVSVTDGSLADMGLDGDQMTADPDDDDAGHFSGMCMSPWTLLDSNRST
jgi:hypothetical protein